MRPTTRATDEKLRSIRFRPKRDHRRACRLEHCASNGTENGSRDAAATSRRHADDAGVELRRPFGDCGSRIVTANDVYRVVRAPERGRRMLLETLGIAIVVRHRNRGERGAEAIGQSQGRRHCREREL
jgi:hypothetical protein